MGLVYQNSDSENANNGSEVEKRISLLVWLNRASDQYKLRRYGDIIYFSRKKQYVVLYVPEKDADDIIDELSNQNFIKQVEKSCHDQLDFSAEHEEELMQKMKLDAEKRLAEDEDLPR